VRHGLAILGLAVLTVVVGADPVRAQTAEGLPPGHPPTGDGDPHGRGAAGGSVPGMFVPPEDEEREDSTLRPGTIAVDVRDADGGPVAGEQVSLGVLVNSIAKGDSRSHLQAVTDGSGRALFGGLETASNVAYRVSVGFQGGLFAAAPFQLQQTKAMRVVLHVYPVTSDIQQARVVGEAVVAAEVRDDRIQIEEVLTMYNLGRTAWQPRDVAMALPQGFTAFNAQASMTDQGVDEARGAVRLHGTFPPGKGVVEFRWQVPWSGEPQVDLDIGMPPHLAIARVMMAAGGSMSLEASGFPAAEVRHDGQGQSFWVTERQMRPDEPRLSALSMSIRGLPTRGLGPPVATMLAAVAVALGVFAALRQGRPQGAPKGDLEATLLDELLSLERARASGEVGPRTYERQRQRLIDSLSRVLAGS
jgi:hypothetical protein